MKTNLPKATTLPAEKNLEERHTELYKEFLPTLQRYTEMASEALTLQVAIYHQYLRKAFKTTTGEVPLICKFSARETPATVRGILTQLEENKVQVERVIYDPVRHDFYLFGQTPTK